MSQTSISTANVCRFVDIASRRQDLNIREITFLYRRCVMMPTVAECAQTAPALPRMKTDPPDLNPGEMVLVMGVLANPRETRAAGNAHFLECVKKTRKGHSVGTLSSTNPMDSAAGTWKYVTLVASIASFDRRCERRQSLASDAMLFLLTLGDHTRYRHPMSAPSRS
ncbi:hypothetical protein ARMSODRAFT_979905 [Armillaria solidipes]|uniref:Uncharacterized protein n=1 Tax=Armillaria solidipes TaxID=1076256 RepID=A0A2H3AXS6_9AGAR|nr:hypothetical protein ARMSODRAFT_979905 [Armillaria solidipes]